MVGGVDDESVFCVGAILERFEDTADLFVEMCDQSVVFTELVADDFLGSRPRRESFVATGTTF